MEFTFNDQEPVADVVEETAPVVEEVATEEVVVEEKPKKAAKNNLVAVHSTKKVFWEGVGTLNVGINHVTPENAEKWIAAKYYVTAVEETTK